MLGFVSETLILAGGQSDKILASLGITPPRRGAHIHCPFPHHPDRRPSWRWDDRSGRFHCSCGTGDLLDLIVQTRYALTVTEAAIYVRRVLSLPVGNAPGETSEQRAVRSEKLTTQLRENQHRKARADVEFQAESARLLAFALALYARSASAAGTIVENYLRNRGIQVVPDLARFVEYRGLPAMCVPFGIPDEPEPGRLSMRPERVMGVHLTFLQVDGSGKAKDAKGRNKIMIGRGHDFPIVLAPPNDIGGLVIAEGIEDALTGHQHTGLGAWAAGSATRLPVIARHVPAYVETVTLIEDDNEAGRSGCRVLASAHHGHGIDVLIERNEVGHAA